MVLSLTSSGEENVELYILCTSAPPICGTEAKTQHTLNILDSSGAYRTNTCNDLVATEKTHTSQIKGGIHLI